MKVGRLKRDFKWNWGMSLERDYRTHNPMAKIISIWFFKLNILPDEAAFVDKYDYNGFWWKKEILTNLTITLKTKSINLIYWISIKTK